MAGPRGVRQREAQLGFDALSIEGGLLSADWLSRAAQLRAGGQGEPDYRIPRGLNLRDEIGRYWRIAQAHWSDFALGRSSGADPRALAERFVHALLRDSLGFMSLVAVEPVTIAERSYPIGCSALGGRVPVVTAPAASGLDTLALAFGDGSRRRSAFGLAQEFLNAADAAMWGLASDGLVLRIVRDNASLTRPAWIEADLSRIFTEELYADFAALWLVAHETRFGRPDQLVTECALETWRNAGREEGTRAREHLRRGVEEALAALGQGFLAHPDNQPLRNALQDGSLTTRDYFNQLLRLVYRLIFLLTVEERGLLHPDDSSEVARGLYGEGYGLRHLRARSARRSGHDRFSDLWEATKIGFRGLAGGEPRLALPALAGIFARTQCGTLDGARLENRVLLLAVFRLSWLRGEGGLSRVNWRDMGPEELGSVYESLLELVPQITKDGRQFVFATGTETKGNARKTSGSYYTPESLVQMLLDSGLEPIVESTIAGHPASPAEALLQLSIVDPACGSGHFLLAAARRLAGHVARCQANSTPSAAEYRHALRQVVGQCIYGIDLNPMAVELCKVSLWMEAVEPGLPLTFLDSHIQNGNALLGTTPDLMAKGIPDAAWEPIEGDDRKTATALKKRNKKAASGQRALDTLWADPSLHETHAVTEAVARLEATPDADLASLTNKQQQWDGILASPEYRHQRFVADAWCSAFVWPKQPGPLADAAPTNELWRQIRDAKGHPPALTSRTIEDLAMQHHFFHWHLAFPQPFARGGFDVVLGNPPWERVNAEARQFFAATRPDIAEAMTSQRRELIKDLAASEPHLFARFAEAQRQASAEIQFFQGSGLYPRLNQARINTYLLFTEMALHACRPQGRIGMIVPSGVATDEIARDLFSFLMAEGRLESLLDFENRRGLFPAVDSRVKFCLLTLRGTRAERPSRFAFFLQGTDDLSAEDRTWSLTEAELHLLSPISGLCPTFRTDRDRRLALGIYTRMQPLVCQQRSESDWVQSDFLIMFRSDDSTHLYRTLSQLAIPEPSQASLPLLPVGDLTYLPVWEAKLLHQFDHRYSTFANVPTAERVKGNATEVPAQNKDSVWIALPRYWVAAHSISEILDGRDWTRQWLVGYRDITNATNERTAIASVLPQGGAAQPLNLFLPESPLHACIWVAAMNSFVLDYLVRQRIGGVHLNITSCRQLPMIAPSRLSQGQIELLRTRVLELVYTSPAMEAFAFDLGHEGPPFGWDPRRRFLLRCELDAAMFHLYGLSREDTAYVMDTFPIVSRNDEKAHGEYRTKRVVLELYDAMAEAAAGRREYIAFAPEAAEMVIGRTTHDLPVDSAGVTLPSWPDGAWQRPHADQGAEAGVALAAVLKAFGRPTPSRLVRLAAILSLEPRLLSPSLGKEEAAAWRRVVGVDAAPLPAGVASFVPAADNAWGAALTHLRGNHLLIEDSQANTWAPSPGLEVLQTDGWPDGRARMVVSVLLRRDERDVLQGLPEAVQRWVDGAAA
jgi:hypothetical protein